MFVVQIDKALGLSADKRGRLIDLLSSDVPPPKKFGQADYWYLMYQMTRLPEDRMKAILDEPQWRMLSRQFMQARGMEPWLKGNGILAADERSPGPATITTRIVVRGRLDVAPAIDAVVAPAPAPARAATPKK